VHCKEYGQHYVIIIFNVTVAAVVAAAAAAAGDVKLYQIKLNSSLTSTNSLSNYFPPVRALSNIRKGSKQRTVKALVR
jgi:hypothetical protein